MRSAVFSPSFSPHSPSPPRQPPAVSRPRASPRLRPTVGPGDTWTARITVKQHGTRPIPDAKPTLTIQGENGATQDVRREADGQGRRVRRLGRLPDSGQWSLR